nr:late embryogenesis abundant protein, LEA-14 [Tanacetum cinerariifolium]
PAAPSIAADVSVSAVSTTTTDVSPAPTLPVESVAQVHANESGPDENQTASEQVTQNWMVITFHIPFWNEKWLVQGGTALELASPEQTAAGKDVSNPFMAVMVCQKPLGYFSSPMIHVPRAGLFIHLPG